MEREKLESLLIDYIDGNLNDAERAMVEKELEQTESTAKLYSQLKEVLDLMANSKAKVPDISLKQNFEKALQAEISKSDSASAKASADKQVFFSPSVLRVAAAVVMVMARVSIGNWINTTRQHD